MYTGIAEFSSFVDIVFIIILYLLLYVHMKHFVNTKLFMSMIIPFSFTKASYLCFNFILNWDFHNKIKEVYWFLYRICYVFIKSATLWLHPYLFTYLLLGNLLICVMVYIYTHCKICDTTDINCIHKFWMTHTCDKNMCHRYEIFNRFYLSSYVIWIFWGNNNIQ